MKLTFGKGVRDGLPICLGYVSVSFAFGMMVVEGGLPAWVGVLTGDRVPDPLAASLKAGQLKGKRK